MKILIYFAITFYGCTNAFANSDNTSGRQLNTNAQKQDEESLKSLHETPTASGTPKPKPNGGKIVNPDLVNAVGKGAVIPKDKLSQKQLTNPGLNQASQNTH